MNILVENEDRGVRSSNFYTLCVGYTCIVYMYHERKVVVVFFVIQAKVTPTKEPKKMSRNKKKMKQSIQCEYNTRDEKTKALKVIY